MKSGKILLLTFLTLLIVQTGFSQTGSPSSASDNRMDWWRDARFGMFIHWGIYAVPAGEWNGKSGYGEWIRTSAEIPLNTYDRFRTEFNPVGFDADAWVKMARDAGMKYIVITSKHHDGFCMFDTKQTDFNIMTTPFKRDPMKELAEACKKYGLKFCFYHSIMDWHHPDYLPRRDWEKDRSAEGADYKRYVQYMKAQLKELLTNYGNIGVVWFDGEWESTWNETYGKEIYKYVRSLQPDIIVNNRVGAGRLDMEGLTRQGAFGGDFGTPEQQIPATGLPGLDWETCMTMNDHWGYNKADKNFKSAKEILQMLADIASKGGNYLLNVGPTALGTIPEESIGRLDSVGKWMMINGESIYGTTASPFPALDWGRCTRKETKGETTLYLHVFNWPDDGKLKLSGLLNTTEKAYMLTDPKENPLAVERMEDALIISLPSTPPDPVNSVVVLHLKGKLDLTEAPLIKAAFDEFIDSLTVELSSNRDNVEIRFTTDTLEPSKDSPLYTAPIVLKVWTTIKARCFRDGKPVSGTSSRAFRLVYPHVPNAVDKERIRQGIRYDYYEGEWDSLPDFKTLKSRKDGLLRDFTFGTRNQDVNFAYNYIGYILVPESEVYRFYVESDDGSDLYINLKHVVKNDGLHGAQERSGVVALSKGYQKIRLGYFNKTGSASLKVYVESKKMPKQPLPKSWLYCY